MKFKGICFKTFATVILTLPQLAMADYRYTFTSGPVTEIIANANIRGNELTPIEPDDFMQIVINTTAAPMTQGVERPSGSAPLGYLVEATSIRMTFGTFTLDTATAVSSPYTSFFINEYDANGLPTNWYFNFVNEPYGSGGTTPDYFEQIALRSNGSAEGSWNEIYGYSDTPPGFYFVNAISGGGSWTLEQISSPVPEVETYAMMMAGLGLIGLVKRRKGKHLANG